MFWLRKNVAENVNGESQAEKVANEAEGFYRSGKMHCAEAVLAAVKNEFLPEAGDELVHLASGFGGGSGAGCICGAVAGGTMAIGLVVKDRKASAALTKELHHWFKEQYRVTCCKALTANGKKRCVEFTANTAGKVAELLQKK
ncbi:C-GCAxxG-C-C family protein [Geomonas sp. Red69]|uniref:C-GCAxxG-C-C family protein n=1 Tax=Geomonas diazotrophica TaxID=2843197 RepID=A0ABX8JKF1_9BACT|nr:MULTISPECIES: C-GCAxxG-C-C family protein [Geomonas]MBU5638589.1 C-GCAxxG-C-C family protein [Geomonas diazotrophica]QWV97137.1 C-GCAxxG-C-C family protein [Geomonas nitrogeniifigens]